MFFYLLLYSYTTIYLMQYSIYLAPRARDRTSFRAELTADTDYSCSAVGLNPKKHSHSKLQRRVRTYHDRTFKIVLESASNDMWTRTVVRKLLPDPKIATTPGREAASRGR